MIERPVPRTDFRHPAAVGLALIVVIFGLGGFWFGTAQIAGAVIATGTVGISGKPKTIQHLDGGIVERIQVEPGDYVQEGDPLILLDDKTIRANLAIYRLRLRDQVVRQQRLLAELEEKDAFEKPPAEIVSRYDLGDLSEATKQQTLLMTARASSRLGELDQLNERIAQFAKQIEGVEGLKSARQQQTQVNATERAAIEELVTRNIAPKNQLLSFDRAAAELAGQIAQHDSEIGRLKNSVSEVEIAKLQVLRTFKESTVSELEDAATKASELMQQIDATSRQLARTVIRAPVSGIIHELSMFTIGGVIQPGQAILQIVPQSERIEFEVQVDPRHIDELSPGQAAFIRFPSFNQRTTPEIVGFVNRISPSSVIDEKSGAAFYRVVVGATETALAELGANVIYPGMPIEVVVPTEERTALEYFLRPLKDSMVRIFREE